MRIVIDLQGAQALGSRNRGIGRYSIALSQAIIRNKKDHEVHLALNGAFLETLGYIRRAFHGLIPPENIHVWEPLVPAYQVDVNNRDRRLASEYYRELFLAQLNPDVIHITSLFEGFGDDAICSVGTLHHHIPTTVTLYDLIPLINKSPYLENPSFEKWYLNRVDHLRRADMCLAISESSRMEGIECLGFDPARSINVGTAADPQFCKIKIGSKEETSLRKLYKLNKPFILYTGGIDHRKNIEGLIRAFGKLPHGIRRSHQLAIVCSVQDVDRTRLMDLARENGIDKNGMVITGFVPEEDLIALYNICKLFVFPSWHEGFGLPALEAMLCGAPVIAANRSSLPEVIGLDDALFDPFDDQSIADAITKGVTDDKFREHLVKHGTRQSAKFLWDDCGKRAVAAFEKVATDSNRHPTVSVPKRPKLAYVSPMPPAKTGIADYSAELLPELSRHYAIDVVVKNESLDDVAYPLFDRTIGLVSADAFRNNWKSYDRIVYHFGNSDHHDHMFELLRETSGVVVLHDFFISGIVAHREWHGQVPSAWAEELYRSHGYAGPLLRKTAEVESDAVWALPCSFSVVDEAHGVVVHSQNGIRLAKHWYGQSVSEKFDLVPHLRLPPLDKVNRKAARKELAIADGCFTVCSFGMVGPTKLNHMLLKAWDKSRLSKSSKCRLVFVGQNDFGPYGQDLLALIEKGRRKGSVTVTGWADHDMFRAYLASADLAVQLRARSRGETSGTVLDCMNYGVPLIVNANGSMSDLSRDAAVVLEDDFSVDDLVAALDQLYSDHEKRDIMGAAGRSVIHTDHAPRACADLYRNSIERHYLKKELLDQFVTKISKLTLTNDEMLKFCTSASRALSREQEHLFIDISELAVFDAKTGIQRVVRNILRELLRGDLTAHRVEPVYLDPDILQYRYARKFTSSFLDVSIGNIEDDVVDFTERDTLLFLDLNPNGVPKIENHIASLTNIGVKTAFIIYDLLPIKLPHCFPPEAEHNHRRWLHCVASGAMAICISETVASDLKRYLSENYPTSTVEVSNFPLGSELDVRSVAVAEAAGEVAELDIDFTKPTFLMVGTIEPRKGHAEVLDAFEKLWAAGHDLNLCIVGKPGWMVENLIARMDLLSVCEARLKWLRQISDVTLHQVYEQATCLIGASLDEGFGLPLAEAAQYGLPLIARDIPVFREVCGGSATYFKENLAGIIIKWIDDHPNDRHIKSDKVIITRWNQSAKSLLKALIN